MGLKKFVKKNAPDWLLPLIRAGYKTLKRPYKLIQERKKKAELKKKIPGIIERADKLLPYYCDDLSRLILSDCEKSLLTHEPNIFINRAVKQGWKYHEIYSDVSIYQYIDKENFSRIIVICNDKHCHELEYTRVLLDLSNWAGKYKILTFDEFKKAPDISEHDFIVPIKISTLKIVFRMYRKNLPYHNVCYGGLIAIREDIQYFDVFDPVDDEIIIDAGCYDGTTAKQFLGWGGGKVKKIYSFEFDPVNAAKCEENLKDLRDKVTLIKKGTWDKDEILQVNASGTSGSSTRTEGNNTVYLTSIDSVVKDERVTFIKMDVEGAELKSLIGAKNTIITNRPRLAICVYHKPEDIYEIPEYILSLVPEYKFYLRHYCSVNYETVLYASCD